MAYTGGLHQAKDSPFRQTNFSEKGERDIETDGFASKTDASVFAKAGSKMMMMKARMEHLQQQMQGTQGSTANT